jgi:hypothetical protein
MQAAVVPQPLDLTPYEGKVIEVSGRLHGNLWEARFEGVVLNDIGAVSHLKELQSDRLWNKPDRKN